jgi:hypothetical protein
MRTRGLWIWVAGVGIGLALVLGARGARAQDLKASGADLCFTCHAELKAKFSQADVRPREAGQVRVVPQPARGPLS